MKKILIVDTTGEVDIERKGNIIDADITIVHSLEGLLEHVKCRYTFDYASWRKAHPPNGTMYSAIGLPLEGRRLELESQLPYWFAILFFLKGEEQLATALGAAAIASTCGCRHVRIHVQNVDTFRWLPFKALRGPFSSSWGGYGSFRIGDVGVLIDLKYRCGSSAENWPVALYHEILHRGDWGKRTAEEIFKEVWPEFPWRDYADVGFFA
ncbi:MAG TPA: hypothetical protein VFT82_01710 [Candidatus Paceibacterota bacterium]|nr:hypothetical protein [Candidatus Paceibacterota bacterium]